MLRRASLLLLIGLTLCAQPFGRPPALRNIGLDQRLGAQVPLDLTFKDESGATVRLRDLIHGRPVVLSLVYYRCPMLCNLVLNSTLHAMRNINLKPGVDYDSISVSFDPAETPDLAAAKKASYVERGGSASWRFLTGQQPEIRSLTETVGFRYAWDPVTQQWAHASGIMVLTPEGKVARYIYGINFPNQDLRLALVEASARRIGSAADQILLFCFHYDPTRGRYGLAILNTLKVLGSLTALALGTFVFTMIRREDRPHE